MENAPKTYSAVLNGNNTEAGEIDHQIKVEFEKKDDRYILKKYQMITDKEAFVSGNPLDVGNSGDEPGMENSGNLGDSVKEDNEKEPNESGDATNSDSEQTDKEQPVDAEEGTKSGETEEGQKKQEESKPE